MATGDDSEQIILMGRHEMDRDEAQAAADVTTGQLLEKNGEQVQPHATAGGAVGSKKIAFGWRAVGNQRGSTIPSGELVHYVDASGGRVQMPVAVGNSVTEGTPAVSDGSGGVRAYDAAGGDSAAGVIGEFAEDLDNTGGTGPAYVKVDL